MFFSGQISVSEIKEVLTSLLILKYKENVYFCFFKVCFEIQSFKKKWKMNTLLHHFLFIDTSFGNNYWE